jgi:carboxyl-terminal processing protease
MSTRTAGRRLLWVTVFASLSALALATYSISATDKKKDDDLFRQIELFSDALTYVQSDYVTEVKSKDLIYGALKGMLSSLDPHSQFMDPDAYNELKTDTEGKFGGIGIEISQRDGILTVVTPIEDTPAWKAGLKPNDRIVKIDGKVTRDMTLPEAVKMLRGKPGDPVTVTVLRESVKKVMDFKLVRGIITITDIKEARILEDGIGYIRIVEFREDTDKNLISSLEKLQGQGMQALVLDLRNNPGGLLDSAVNCADEFVENGKVIVSTKGRKKDQDTEFLAKNPKPMLTLPMVVLINEGSASGSEIVAGCLQDYKRAVIIGNKSFGKGSVQTVIPLADGSGLRLTTSKYYTPLGREIHGKGVEPDIEVPVPDVSEDDAKDKNKDEAALSIEEVFDQVDVPADPAKPNAVKEAYDYKKDVQVVRALDVLKALRIVGAARTEPKR